MENTIDVCITFDTTGSMYPCLTQLRRNVEATIRRLFKDIPDLRIAIIAHGDYCDRDTTYVTKIFDFSRDVEEIAAFVRNVERTFGGDAPECYELVLHEARTKLSWKPGRAKVLVMNGDDVPHPPTYRDNVLKIDWRDELGLLIEAGISVYGVHAMPGIRRHSRPFYEEIARTTGGFYLTLDQFNYISDLIMGICYKQESPEALEEFVITIKKTGRMSRGLSHSFSALKGEKVDWDDHYAPTPTRRRPRTSSKVVLYAFEKDGLTPVPAGRFQTLDVDSEAKIREFVQDQGAEFAPGRSFYQLVKHGKKRYKVQSYKEVILQDKESGDFFHGSEAREMLGLMKWQPKSDGIVTESLPPTRQPENYKVFIQSTSYTRKLVPGTSLLYEIKDWEHEEAA